MADNQHTVLPHRTDRVSYEGGRSDYNEQGIRTTFFKNLQRRHAPSFLISPACLRCSGRSGPFRFPTRFSVSFLAFCEALRATALLVGFMMGVFRCCLLLVVGEVGDRRPELVCLISMGLTKAVVMTAAGGLVRSV